MKEWYALIDSIAKSIVKIETPDGHGTGFMCLNNESKSFVAIATAHHVVEQADKWQQPIRLYNSLNTVLLSEGQRVIIPDRIKDSALIIIATPQISALGFPPKPIPLLAANQHLRIGVEVAWMGYPGIGPDTLCFFSGKISAFQKSTSSYLVDGVAINGVSGGPVLYRPNKGDDEVRVVGAITAYMPNRQMSGPLPGLSIAQDVSPLHDFAKHTQTLEEAEQKKKEQEAEKQVSPTSVPPPK